MCNMKTLFVGLALMVCAVATAQTDMTYRISDPDFEQEGRSQWKTNSFGRQGNNDFKLKHGGYYREVWSGGTAGDAYIYQDLTNMPVGTYTLTMTCQNIKQSSPSQVCTGTWIYLNDKKTEFNRPDDYSVTAVVKDGSIRIGAEIKNCTGNYVCIDNVRLSYQIIYDDVKDYLESLVAEADKLDQHDNSAEHTELIAARDVLQALMNAAQNEGLDAAVKRMQEAMRAYRFTLASPTNPLDMTELISDPGFEKGGDGWTLDGMGPQGNNDFRKVGNTYAEKWCERGRGVDNGSLRQTLTDLPNGRYRMTAVAQNIQQDSPNSSQRGCYIFADSTKTEVGVYGKYQVEFVCVTGEVTIGFQTLSATGNYCCVDDFHLYYTGADEEAVQAAFNALIKQAESLVPKDMNTSVKTALQQAIADAKAVIGNEGRDTASQALQAAITAALASNALYVQLDAIIVKGEKALASAKPYGREQLETAVNNAKGMKASGDIDADKVKATEDLVEKGIFAYNVLNGAGTEPKVTTGEVIVGSCAMVGRMKATGNNIIERGFCWAENPNPTVLDAHSSYNQSNDETNWSPVYVLYDVKPSTEYWVRAYALTKTYAVGYGEPIRVITLPKGETAYTFLWNGDDDHNAWLDNAMREATAYYNTWTAIKGFHPTANYSPGTETADCSYGGWINVGPWRCNTPTMVHEMMHGTGVGQHGRYWSQELKPDIWWQGERANRITHFFENYDASRGNYNCNGDGMHICYQGNGNDMQQIRSCLLMQAMYEDGLPAVSDGACPFYSFESIDTLHYYITNNEYGANSKYLCESGGKLTYKAISPGELLADSTYAWNVLYDKMTGLYFIRNLKTGKYFKHNGSTVTLSNTKPSIRETIQLMPARIWSEYKFGTKTIKKKPYWLAQGSRVERPNVIAVNGASASSVVTPVLDFSNNATRQFWMIYSKEEVIEMETARQIQNNELLERLIAGSKAVAASSHGGTAIGQDEAFIALVQGVEADKNQFSADETEAAIQMLYANLADYLPAIEVKDSIDISFIMEDAELETGVGWTGMPTLKNGMLQSTNTEVFTATQQLPFKMPKGKYGLRVRGFQRPGEIATAMKDYAAGKNNVKATITIGTKTQAIMHIAQGGADVRLGKGGTETLYSGLYVPINSTAIRAYLDAGRYDNLLYMENAEAKNLRVGVKQTRIVPNDQLVVDGFGLYYYGTTDKTDIAELKSDSVSDEVEGYYTLGGVRLERPGRGITVVRLKDGRCVKALR